MIEQVQSDRAADPEACHYVRCRPRTGQQVAGDALELHPPLPSSLAGPAHPPPCLVVIVVLLLLAQSSSSHPPNAVLFCE
eukprot:790064-Rhodomonas_salina.2